MELPPLPEAWGNYAIQGIVEVLPGTAISWWPQAPGWRYLGLLLALLLARYAWRRWQRWLRNRYRREALRQLQELEQLHRSETSLLQPLARLLKATALQLAPRSEVASLSGEAWPTWLNIQTAKPVFSSHSCALLAQAQYRAPASIDAPEIAGLVADARSWIRTHREPGHA